LIHNHVTKEKEMSKFTRCNIYTTLFLWVFSLGVVSTLWAVDRKDPEAVAGHLLKAMQENNLDTIFEIMAEGEKKHFSPFSSENRLALETMVKKIIEKIGEKAKVAELRKCATLTGKPGIAVKVSTAEGEVHVFILSKEGDNYSFVSFQTLSARFYNRLVLVKKLD
jgi:hypothetical protein